MKEEKNAVRHIRDIPVVPQPFVSKMITSDPAEPQSTWAQMARSDDNYLTRMEQALGKISFSPADNPSGYAYLNRFRERYDPLDLARKTPAESHATAVIESKKGDAPSKVQISYGK